MRRLVWFIEALWMGTQMPWGRTRLCLQSTQSFFLHCGYDIP